MAKFTILVVFLLFLVSTMLPQIYGASVSHVSNVQVEDAVPLHGSNKTSETVGYWYGIYTSDPSEVASKHPQPAGLESGVILYVCRLKVNDVYIPGKLYTTPSFHYCSVAHDDHEHLVYENFGLLVSIPGKTSWVAVQHNGLPSNPISANHGSNIICRGRHESDLIPGVYNQQEHSCHVTKTGNVHILRTNIQVLTGIPTTEPPCEAIGIC